MPHWYSVLMDCSTVLGSRSSALKRRSISSSFMKTEPTHPLKRTVLQSTPVRPAISRARSSLTPPSTTKFDPKMASRDNPRRPTDSLAFSSSTADRQVVTIGSRRSVQALITCSKFSISTNRCKSSMTTTLFRQNVSRFGISHSVRSLMSMCLTVNTSAAGFIVRSASNIALVLPPSGGATTSTL